tara:strand:- start:7099 stop:8562 length:1464 start_codon:yes stop_codon:yes gene_type:complete
MSKDLKKETFQGFFWLFTGSSSQAALKFIVLAILARLISPEDFGLVAVTTIFLGFSKIFSQLGMGAALVQKKEITKEHIRTAYTVSLLIGVFFCALTLLFSDNIALYFNMLELSKVLRYASCIFIIDSFISVSQSLLQRNLRMKHFALADFISYLISFGVLGVFLAYLGYGVYALVYAYILQAILKAVILSYLEPHSIVPFFNKKSFNDLFFFGSGHTLARIANFFANQGDNLIVGKMMSADALGYYSNAYQLMVAPVNLIGQSLNVVLFPALASVQTDLIKVKKAYYKSIQLVAYTSFIISSVLFINAKEIVLILLGENWLDVIVPFQILAVGTVFRMTSKIGDSLMTAMGDEFRRAIIQIVYAICIIIFSYIGHFWGIKGVAIGVVIAILFNFILMTHFSLLQFKGNWRNFMVIYTKPFFFSVVVFTFSYLVLCVLRSINLNLIITEIIYLLLVLGFLVIVTLRFKNVLGVSNEIDSILSKILKK